jgi:tricorn protease
MPRLGCALCLLLFLAGAVCAAAAEDDSHLLLQKPALGRTQIVFVCAGDLWSVSRDGGEATRLTVGAGVESNPVFSPDGTRIAFTGEYDGNVDVFVIPASGGVPKRLTFHPGEDDAVGWTPDGKQVLFRSPRNSYSYFDRLFTVPVEGGFPTEVPLPMAQQGSFSPDGSRIAYVPNPKWQEAWKRYRGGQTTPIWIATLSSGRIEKIPRDNSNDFNPMWAGERIYFLSDRNGPVTLFSYDTRSKQVKQELENHDLDMKSASIGPDGIVYEQFGSLHLYDLKSGAAKQVNVRIAGDMLELRERIVNVSKRLESARISPTGARAVFQARGDILTVPAEKGDARNLTNTMGVMERDPAWSPDGKTIAYFSDESGEYALHLRGQNGKGEVKKISLGAGFYFSPRWSPDSKKIAYRDSHLSIWYVDLEQKKPVKVDQDIYWTFGGPPPEWSPDSRWLAYEKRLPSHLNAIFVYSIADANHAQLTDGMSDARSPVFDKDGKYLYFTASTDSGPSLEPDIHSFTRPVTRSIYLVVLAKDQPSPLAPESDEEKPAGETKSADKKDEADQKPEAAKDAKDAKEKAPEKIVLAIDFDNIGQRILALPLPARRYIGLQIGKAGELYALEAPAPAPGVEFNFTVHRFDLKKRKSDVGPSAVRFFEISQNGEKMLYRQGDRWFIKAPKPITSGGPGPGAQPPGGGDGDEGLLKTDGLEVRVDPSAEWKQIYHEVWRVERDFFYDPNYHGLNLLAAERKYQPYLANIASRNDLNYLFEEMLGELTVGHLFIAGGDTPEVKRIQTGLLGADYKIENGHYRFARVYNGENWNPELKAPLTQPGVNVVAGEYLLAVNGRELRATDNVYGFFEETAGKQVLLKVGPDPAGAKSREVSIVPVPTETRLRNLAWIEDNRRKVDQMTGGRVAYVYMPDTAFGGYANFTRYFFAQVGKEAVIVDERFNGGGALASDIIEILQRKLLSLVATRDGEDEDQPQGAIFGPKVMIINESAGSGGDAMPWYFRRAGVGKLIGKRTWGGLVGRAAAPELMDGGFVSAPSSGVWNPDGHWDVENRGITPDIEVELDPELTMQGHDPQLEKAVEVVMEELKQSPVPHPHRPPYPNYHAEGAAPH